MTRAGSLGDFEAKDAIAKVRMTHVWSVKPMFDRLRMMFVVTAVSDICYSKEPNGCRGTASLSN